MAAAIVLCGALVWPLPSSRGAHDPHVPATEQEAVQGVWQDVQDIWQFVLRDRVVALAMVQWTIGAILGLVVATLVPGFAERLLHVQRRGRRVRHGARGHRHGGRHGAA